MNLFNNDIYWGCDIVDFLIVIRLKYLIVKESENACIKEGIIVSLGKERQFIYSIMCLHKIHSFLSNYFLSVHLYNINGQFSYIRILMGTSDALNISQNVRIKINEEIIFSSGNICNLQRYSIYDIS